MRRSSRVLFVFLLPVVLIGPIGARAASAQETLSHGSIGGRVTDESGQGIAGAAITARHLDTNVASTTTTDRDGRFRFAHLRVGVYEVVIRADRLEPLIRRFTIVAGSAFDWPAVLGVKRVESSLTVTADAATLETARSQIASTLSSTELAATPLNGRNFLDLALLVPGVSLPNVGGGTQLFPETSAVPGLSLSIGSQRNLSNSFIVDGLSANDDSAALSGISYGVDALDQIQIVTSGGQAELGRALGGYVNIVTRSGTNRLRGDAFTFIRDDALSAANKLSATRLPMHQNQFGASLGGPLQRDRTFFFGNVERRQLDQSGLVTIPAATVATINARLSAVGYAGQLVATGIYSNPIDTTHVLAKIDHNVSDGSHVSVRYSAYGADSLNSRAAGGIIAPSASAGLDNLDQTVAAGSTFVLSPRTVLEMRGQAAWSDLKAPPSDPIGPAVSISGNASFGTSSGSPTGRKSQMYEAVGNLSHQIGPHAVRAGVDFLYNDATITFPRSVRGSYSFSSLANFLIGTYNNSGFTQTFGETVVAQTNPNVGAYVQDEWRVTSGVTVNAGLRYDLQFLDTINTDANNWSPRLGIVWSPFKSRRMLVRANAGRFFDRIPLRAVANALLSAGNTTDLSQLRQIAVSLSPAQTGAPVFPAILTSVVPTTTLVNLTTMDRGIQNAYADQVSLEWQQQWSRAGTISVGYETLRGRQLIMQINQNVPTCAVSGSNNGCRPNPSYANNNQYSSVGRSDYDALTISLVQQPKAWLSYRVSYTLSKAMNNLGETFFASPIDPTDLSKDWGRSDNDQRHRLVVSGSVSTPAQSGASIWSRLTSRLQISGVAQYYSALPFNITTGANTIQGTAARPVVNGEFISRNAGVAGGFRTVSVRVSRSISLGRRVEMDALVEAFNLFNRRNDVARVTVFGPGTYPTNPASNFGQVTVVGDPRSVQVGLRVRF